MIDFRIAFCTTCKGRSQHIQQTLLKNIQDNPGEGSVFVLLDYGSNDGLAEYVRDSCQEHLVSGKLVFYQNKEAAVFKMAHAKNMVHRLGILEKADILVNLDADNFTGVGFSDYIRENFERTKADQQEIFMWPRMVKGVLSRGISGRIVLTKTAFLVSGGYDEKYETHSPDDKDFNARLRRLGYCAQEIDSKYLLAVNHNDRMRFREYPQALDLMRESYGICQISRVVNDGNIGCGVVYRNFNSVPIVLDKIPTRIFGIGLHKTATTSLHTAFTLLGFKSGHWENAHWAKAIWSDISNLGRSLSLEQFYALSDLPIPLFYRELDRAYPNSKFILTIRDDAVWLESVRKHFDHDSNEFRQAWDNDPFTHNVHALIYGRKKFDEAVFLARYQQHNREVVEYFKNRPGDLLVLDMSKNPGWTRLCEFLKCPVPDRDYPVKFVTANRKENKCRENPVVPYL